MSTSLAIVGDFNASNLSHVATQDAIGHSAAAFGLPIEAEWVGTEEAAGSEGLERLSAFNGLWIAPASPYRSLEGALGAIRLARERKIPLLGTCGGFQHTVIEYARNVMGIANAEHEESTPGGAQLVISRLTCSLVGRTGTVRLEPGSRVARACSGTTTQEQYLCNFGVNPAYVARLQVSDLRIVGTDEDGAVRAVELANHPFFVGTLFLPQLRSRPSAPHPLISAFVQASCRVGAIPVVESGCCK